MKKFDNPGFSQKIIRWYQEHKRDLPWRNTQNPYYIWLSEVILQQTRVNQGLPYYQKFIQQYPQLEDLALASEDEVLRLWQGLGYYSRGRNLHQTARYIVKELEGNFPNTYSDLIKLKGIGKYTAAAIASFAFGEAVAVVDGNVYRVLARYFGLEHDIASSEGVRIFADSAQNLVTKEDPGTYNQAIMEFGALQCTPKKPNCLFCPLMQDCMAFQQGKQAVLPVKSKKTQKKERFFQYLVLSFEDQRALRKRDNSDIWGGLYDFLLLESSTFLSLEEILRESGLDFFSDMLIFEGESAIFSHTLTHQKIKVKFYEISIKNKGLPMSWLLEKKLSFYGDEEIKKLPKPILIDKFLHKKKFS